MRSVCQALTNNIISNTLLTVDHHSTFYFIIIAQYNINMMFWNGRKVVIFMSKDNIPKDLPNGHDKSYDKGFNDGLKEFNKMFQEQ